MTGADIFRLVLLILVFAVWGWLTWGIHKKLHARATEANTSTGAEFGKWFGSAADRQERNTFLFLTAVLLAMLALRLLT